MTTEEKHISQYVYSSWSAPKGPTLSYSVIPTVFLGTAAVTDTENFTCEDYTARATVFKSTESCANGGFVIRLEGSPANNRYTHPPLVRIVEHDQVEIHIRGDLEAATFMRALQEAIRLALRETSEDSAE